MGSVLLARLLAVTLTVAAAAAVPAPAAGAGVERTHRPIPVIYDSDMDFDDASTLAYLCAEHRQRRIDLRAVTVANDGFGIPGRALRHAHSVLEQCGAPRIPVADGSTGGGVHPAPAETVAVIETVLSDALGDGGLRSDPAPVSAPELIRRTIAASPAKVTVLTTGPMTNLATALRGNHSRSGGPSRLAERINRIYVMGGAISVPGNLFGSALPGFDNTQEFNMWLDPVSARDVFRAVRANTVHLIPLDATQFVPITPAFVDRLAADRRTSSAELTYRIISHPEMTSLINLGVMFWWDALAAATAFRGDALNTTFRDVRIDVVQDGAQSGRTVATPTGARLRAAFTADRTRFEQTFLDALNERIPA